ncbi:hypothetical protein HNQ94_002789 [Salirhabdus euzebyi]|uniref:Sporulation protein YqfD n=1 Tax=Salirhabdus euzebyi TaxID=394506 RepID=A0A841Q7L1_9BACI|nr:sporulation protein YqfD [Salirhabdus euzebyi]MBB6454314.1 hypothetical protein [Salirhabdus euzebyi]
MKFKQGLFFKGYITFYVEGKRPEIFLNKCLAENIPIWDIRRIKSDKCEAKVHLKHLRDVKKIRRMLGYKISFKDKFGLPFILSKLKIKKPLVVGLFLSILLVFILSNIVWQVKIVGVSPEMEYKIEERLDAYGLKKGIFKFSIGSIDDIERNITNELKDVMWIGIEEKGTTYVVQGVEKTIADKEQDNTPQHLVARVEGNIVRMLVETGAPQVSVDQFVNKGDILVSGIIGQDQSDNEDDDDEKEQDGNQQYVHAEGTVIAETWYTSETTVPLTYQHETLTGEQDNQYRLGIGNLSLPIWDIFAPDYSHTLVEKEEKPLYFLNMKLPFSILKKTIHEKDIIKGERTEKKAIQEGIEQAKRELKKHIDFEAKIIEERILHQTLENGKVKLNIYFRVQENIAVPQPIYQGE